MGVKLERREMEEREGWGEAAEGRREREGGRGKEGDGRRERDAPTQPENKK